MKEVSTISEEVCDVRLLKSCPLCGSRNNRPVKTERNQFAPAALPEVAKFNGTWIQLLKCLDCSFGYTKEIPLSPTFFASRYDNTWFDPAHEVASFRKSAIINELFDNLAAEGVQKGKLLDVGSFAGKLLFFAAQKGFSPEGVEINPKLASYSQEKLGFKVHSGDFKSVELPTETYDVITIIDVLEHLLEPKLVLLNLHRSLKPGGLLYIKVPNFPMQVLKQNIANFLRISPVGMFACFGHVNHFTNQSMLRVLNEVGLNLVQVRMARSEKWDEGKSLYWLRNAFRDFNWACSSLVYKLTGISIGFNHIYIARKNGK